MANANSFPRWVPPRLWVSLWSSPLSHWGRATAGGVSNIGNARSFLSICVQDGLIIPKINAWAGMSISYSPCFELANSRTKRGWILVKKSWSVISFKLHQSDQYLCLQNADIDVCTSPSLYIRLIILDLARRVLKTFSRMHRASYWPTLEECHLSGTGLVADNLHFVVLLHSHLLSK